MYIYIYIYTYIRPDAIWSPEIYFAYHFFLFCYCFLFLNYFFCLSIASTRRLSRFDLLRRTFFLDPLASLSLQGSLKSLYRTLSFSQGPSKDVCNHFGSRSNCTVLRFNASLSLHDASGSKMCAKLVRFAQF